VLRLLTPAEFVARGPGRTIRARLTRFDTQAGTQACATHVRTIVGVLTRFGTLVPRRACGTRHAGKWRSESVSRPHSEPTPCEAESSPAARHAVANSTSTIRAASQHTDELKLVGSDSRLIAALLAGARTRPIEAPPLDRHRSSFVLVENSVGRPPEKRREGTLNHHRRTASSAIQQTTQRIVRLRPGCAFRVLEQPGPLTARVRNER